MFSLRDFFHLPELDYWVEQITEESSGLILIAGLDARPRQLSKTTGTPQLPNSLDLLPSGRSAIFSSLLDSFITQRADLSCQVVAAEKDAIRVPRGYKSRIKVFFHVQAGAAADFGRWMA